MGNETSKDTAEDQAGEADDDDEGAHGLGSRIEIENKKAQARRYCRDLGFGVGAGEGNRTLTVSLGNVSLAAQVLVDGWPLSTRAVLC